MPTFLALAVTLALLAADIGSEPLDVEALISAGGVVDLPEGEFVISRTLTPPNWKGLVLRGKGPARTILKLAADVPMLNLAGVQQATGATVNFRWWEINNLTLDGDGHDGAGLQIRSSSMGRMERVVIQDFKGSAIDARGWCDTLLTDCHFIRCGDAEKQIPAMRLRPANSPNPADPREGNCNNLSFVGCRWEGNPFVSLIIGQYCRVNRFVSCKWHSTLPPNAFDHIWLEGAEDNIFAACNLTNCGGSAVVQRGAIDNTFATCHIGNSRRYGMSQLAYSGQMSGRYQP